MSEAAAAPAAPLVLEAAGLYANVPFAAYLADPCAAPSLTSSTAKTLLDRSPLHAWHEHPRLGGQAAKPSTRAMDTGTIVHALLLGGGQDFRVLPYADYRTKVAQEARDDAREAGLIPILQWELDECGEVAARLRSYVPAGGEHEVTAVWLSGEAGVLSRGRLDIVLARQGVIVDLKTCKDAARAAEGRNIIDYGRDMEAASRIDAIETLLPDLAGRVRFRYLFAEVEPPYAVVDAELSRTMLELGARKWRRAVDRWGECLTADRWPGPHGGKAVIEAPEWALANDMADQLRDNPSTGGAYFGL